MTRLTENTQAYPVTAVLTQLAETLAGHPSVVLQAPPGAGKTTVVPLYLLGAGRLNLKKILILAPRRLAARTAAHRMAHLLGEKVGRTVGYRMRMDTKAGPATRIEVITEGVLPRLLHRDPALSGVGLVIFDEFHERSLEADLGLALCLDMQGVLNPDLKLLVMSATMDTGPVAAMLKKAPVIEAQGRAFPVHTRYVGQHTPSRDMAAVTRAILSAARHEEGNILAFLPGAAEIRHVARQLQGSSLDRRWIVAPLLGSLGFAAQESAICAPSKGFRKIVLATAIAETSLTIEGIGVVIDSGLQRVSRFDVRNGMSRLVTLPVSKASADQRRGRAGRLGPGVCLRLWSEAVNRTLAADRRPEILEADLCGLALELAAWGVRHPGDFKWLNAPPKLAFQSACELLRALDALDDDGKITRSGREMAAMPVHPRLARMLLMARRIGQTRKACDLAALLSDRDPLRFTVGPGETDLQLRYDLLQSWRRRKPFHHPHAQVNAAACRAIVKVADRLYSRLERSTKRRAKTEGSLGKLLAWAYPDRIAMRRSDALGRFVLSGGQGVRLDENDPMAAEAFMVAVEVDGKRRDGRVFRAASYGRGLLEEQFARKLKWRESVQWDPRRQAVNSLRQLTLDALVLRTEPLKQPDREQVVSAMIDGLAQNGLDRLPWNKTLRRWQARVCFLNGALSDDSGWPDLCDEKLLADARRWLEPYLEGINRLQDLAKIDLRGALYNLLSHDQHRQLDGLAPTHWTVPSGSRIPIDYSGKVPILAVRLQEMFGLEQTPVIAGGRQPLLIHLLSPAGRPVQVTQDLAGFWRNSYHEVKKELKGRYPKHFWPEDPLQAEATSRAKPRK